MIDLVTYRFRVGVFSGNAYAKSIKHQNRRRGTGSSIFDYLDNCIDSSFLFYMFYVIFICHFSLIIITHVGVGGLAFSRVTYDCRVFVPTYPVPNMCRCFTVYFFLHLANMYYLRNNYSFDGLYNFCQISIHKNLNCIFTGRTGNTLTGCIIWLFLMNGLLIVLVNPGIVNPGPSPIGDRVRSGNKLNVYFQNVQGLIPFGELNNAHPMLDTTKCLEVSTYLNVAKIDIAILNETWFKSSIADSEFLHPDRYKIFRSDRSKKTHPPDPSNPTRFRRNGGGVMIAVRANLDLTSKEVRLKDGAEILAVEFKTSTGIKFVICTCYRVGTLGSANHDKIIESLRTLLRRRGLSKVFILGDFNLSGVSWSTLAGSCPIEQSFVESFVDLGLQQCVLTPTHCKGKTLDLLLTNSVSNINDLMVGERDSACKSDHFPINFKINVKVNRKKPVRRMCYNFKNVNWERLNHELRHTDWDALLNGTEPEIGWEKFKDKLFNVTDKFVKKCSVKTDGQDPWFDSECYDAWRKKKRLHKVRHKSDRAEIAFTLARKNFKTVVAQKMRETLNESDDSALITKKFWSYVKSKTASQRIPEFVSHKGTVRNCPEEQANLFNDFFFEQFSEASTYDIDIDYSNDWRFDIEFDHRRVRKILSNINANKAYGPDGIHGKLLKNCAVGLAYPISLLFHSCYNIGTLPREWKLGHIVPIFKKGDKHEVSNYRPISLTCLITKVLERIIRDELLALTNGMINDKQHGFRAERSCATNLVGLCDSLALSLNDNIRTDVIYFDFAKAFDSVNHDLILLKLKNKFGIDGRLLKFVTDYLRDRQQQVLISGKFSSMRNAQSGVPQGSILGPLLFIMFIDDISEGISPGTQLSLYADDTKIWRQIVTESDVLRLQKDIEYLHDWSLSNKMRFHPDKCKVLSVTSKISDTISLLSVLPFYNFVYSMGGISLDYVDQEKDLGVIVTSNLDWKDQCSKVLSKANQKLGMARRNCYFVQDVNRRRVLYLTLVRSLFEHCSVIWRPVTKSQISKLDGLQKRAIKWILHEEYMSYSPSTYIQKCRQLKIMPIEDRFDFLDLIFFFKIVKQHIPVILPSYLQPYQGHSRLRNSHMDSLCFVSSISPRASSNAFAKNFFYRTHTKWNHIPLDIREIESITDFKSKLSTYMWGKIIPMDSDSELDHSIETVP